MRCSSAGRSRRWPGSTACRPASAIRRAPAGDRRLLRRRGAEHHPGSQLRRRAMTRCANLYAVAAAAVRRGFPIVVGTEMNAPGNRLVDDFQCAELRRLVPVFLRGARIVYGHSVLQRQCGLGYLGEWAVRTLPLAFPAQRRSTPRSGAASAPRPRSGCAACRPDPDPATLLEEAVMIALPATQRALQLVGRDRLRLNEAQAGRRARRAPAARARRGGRHLLLGPEAAEAVRPPRPQVRGARRPSRRRPARDAQLRPRRRADRCPGTRR